MENEKFKNLLDFVARSLVNDPDAVQVVIEEREHELILQLRVAEDDMGRVIGKGGKTAKAIRTVIKAAGDPKGKKVSVEICE